MERHGTRAFKLSTRRNVEFLRNVHSTSRSGAFESRCNRRLAVSVNTSVHPSCKQRLIGAGNSRFLLRLASWALKCFVRLPRWENLFPHNVHWKGCSPVWIRTCCSSRERLRKRRLQKTHWKGPCPRVVCSECDSDSAAISFSEVEEFIIEELLWTIDMKLHWQVCLKNA